MNRWLFVLIFIVIVFFVQIGYSLFLRKRDDTMDGQPPDDRYPLW